MLKFLGLLAVGFAITQAPARAEDECVFKGKAEDRSTIQLHIISETKAANVAREEAKKACVNAGWSDCDYNHFSYHQIAREYGVGSDKEAFRTEYEVVVTSAECKSFTADSKNKNKFELQGQNYVLIEKRVLPTPVLQTQDCGYKAKQQNLESIPSETSPTVVPVKKIQSRNTAIPGDGPGWKRED